MPNTVKKPRAYVMHRRTGASLSVTVSGTWSIYGHQSKKTEQTIQLAASPAITRLSITAEDLGEWDSTLLVFITSLVRAAESHNGTVTYDVPEALLRLVRLDFAVPPRKGANREKKQDSFLEEVGGAVLALPKAFSTVLEFIGDVCISVLRLHAGKTSMRMADLFQAMHECGAQSLPIVAVTSLLFGLILAFVGAVQLKTFGAQIYVAGLVGIGMLRVMGAVMVGIVMSGRIGAAYAALIGTMQVNEEIDALETLGVSPVEFLVLPRMLALMIMVPVLTIFADLMGILGGFLVGITILDLTPMEYLSATMKMVKYGQGVIGLVYATAFGIVIAVSGCYHGMRCGRSAQAVGQATTTAVVHSIVGIIVVTAIITVIFSILKV